MTAFLLLAAIAAAIFLQLFAGFGFAFWRLRRSQEYAPSTTDGGVASTGAAAWVGWRDFRVVRRTYEDAAQTQCSFYLAPQDGEAPPVYRPGQFLTISVDAADPVSGAPRSYVRCYSLSDAPDKSAYRITIKRSVAPSDRPGLPPGVVSNHLLDTLQEGDILKVKAPSGQFQLDADAATPAIFLAGGIGVTPILSMIKGSFVDHPERAIHLFYGVRNKSEHAFKTVLEDLARRHRSFKLIVFYGAPGPDDRKGSDFQEQGIIDIGALKRLLPSGRCQFYVCGPPAMMAGVFPTLRALGASASDIHFEAFGPASLVGTPGAAGETKAEPRSAIEVRFLRSGRTLAWTGEDANLLDFAERQSVAVESGCRTGNCGSCEIRLISGEVRYLRKPDHELAPDGCLLCVATPVSALVLDA